MKGVDEDGRVNIEDAESVGCGRRRPIAEALWLPDSKYKDLVREREPQAAKIDVVKDKTYFLFFRDL